MSQGTAGVVTGPETRTPRKEEGGWLVWGRVGAHRKDGCLQYVKNTRRKGTALLSVVPKGNLGPKDVKVQGGILR